MRVLPSVLSLLVLVPLTSLLAQEQPPIEPGARVRVTAPDLGVSNQAGTLEALRGDTLFLAVPWELYCPLSSVTKLEVSRDQKSNWSRGLLIGGGIGVVTGAALGLLLFDEEGTDRIFSTAGESAVAGAVVFGGFGGLVGLGIGAFTKRDRWEEVPLDRLRVSLVPQRDGRLGIALALKF